MSTGSFTKIRLIINYSAKRRRPRYNNLHALLQASTNGLLISKCLLSHRFRKGDRVMEGHDTNYLALAERVREIRRQLYGDSGAPMLADALGLLARTWLNYESGVVIPAMV